MSRTARSQTNSPWQRRDQIARRQFLGRVGAAALATTVIPSSLELAETRAVAAAQSAAVKSDTRVDQAYEMREHVALYQKRLPLPDRSTNGDEELYPNKIASYTKALPHDSVGGVDHQAHDAFIGALESGAPARIETIRLGGVVKLANPQAGLGFGLEGADSHHLDIAAAPKFASAEQAGEMAELYWQALTRDVPFSRYDTDPLTNAAAADLSRLSDFRGPRVGGQIRAETLFRGTTDGDLTGPYLSQFLWHDIPYGALPIAQGIRTVIPGIDFLASFDDWLAVQNGAASRRTTRLEPATRYIRNARDLTRYVHEDFTYQAFLNACLILLGANAPFDAENPYRRSATQAGFSTFGAPHVLDLLARVANYSLKAAWYQKWYLHRRLRPEEFGGAVHNLLRKGMDHPVHKDLLNSAALEIIFSRSNTYLLSQAYPEGCPTHPSYPAGHAAIAGACATALKAFFDESSEIHAPVEASADGLSLVPYKGATLTVGGELNKLVANISMGRNAAGVHWRSDASEGLRLGEAVALSIMRDERECFSENFAGFALTKFDGSSVVV